MSDGRLGAVVIREDCPKEIVGTFWVCHGFLDWVEGDNGTDAVNLNQRRVMRFLVERSMARAGHERYPSQRWSACQELDIHTPWNVH